MLVLIAAELLTLALTQSAPHQEERRAAASTCTVPSATLGDEGAPTPEVSTEELKRVLVERSATVLDARPHLEFAVSHIPGAVNVAMKPGVSMAVYVSDVNEVARLVSGNKDTPLVLYCNGPFCGKSKRLSQELAEAGFTHVRRYQLGMPVWRALGGVTQIEPDGVRYVMQDDKTAVWLDARPRGEFARGSLRGAKPLSPDAARAAKDNPAMTQAKNDGTLPMNDHNTRIVVFAATGDEARVVAEALTREAFHNVAFFGGTYAELAILTKGTAAR